MIKASYFLAVACCIISQVLIALEMGYSDIMKATWVLPFVLLLFVNSKGYLSKAVIPYYTFGLLFFAFCFICETATGIKYIGPDINNIGISLFILAISYSFGTNIKDFDKTLGQLAIVTFVASAIYGIVVYLRFLVGADMFSTIYAYDDKNSAAQILLSACIIQYILYTPKSKLLKLINYGAIASLLYIMFILKSRATLLGFFFVIAYYTFAYNDKRVRWIFFSLIGIICAYIVTHPGIYKAVVDGIIFANRDASDFNQLSSGRVDQLDRCLELFSTSPLLGIGNKYFDCYPVITLTQYGLIGALIPFVFLGERIKECFTKLDKAKKIDLCAFLLMITYLLDCLFEAQPPFGPGVKCFPLWMIWGLMLSNKQRIIKI